MIPKNIQDWSYEKVFELIQIGYFETDKLDFKIDLPNKKDSNEKNRLEKTVCAFANTEGGFLIFGIRDEKELSTNERIVGLPLTRELQRDFGDKIQKVQPKIYFEFKNPPIKIPDKNTNIHIIFIPQSQDRPHMTSKNEFWYRTNRGNEMMNYPQLKDSFINEEIRHRKLRLLIWELISISEEGKSMILPDDKIEMSYTLLNFDISPIQSIIGDIYPIIYNDVDLILLLHQIRSRTKIINNMINYFQLEMNNQMPSISNRVLTHNKKLREQIPELLKVIEQVITILITRYGLIMIEKQKKD